MTDGRLPSSWQARLREAVAQTEPTAGGPRMGRSDGWRPNLAPKPVVAADPLHGKQIKHSADAAANKGSYSKVSKTET